MPDTLLITRDAVQNRHDPSRHVIIFSTKEVQLKLTKAFPIYFLSPSFLSHIWTFRPFNVLASRKGCDISTCSFEFQKSGSLGNERSCDLDQSFVGVHEEEE